MSSSLIRGKYIVCEAGTDADSSLVIADGAVFQRNGIIEDVGPYQSLRSRYEPDEELGSEEVAGVSEEWEQFFTREYLVELFDALDLAEIESEEAEEAAELTGKRGHRIEFYIRDNAGREKWKIYDENGELASMRWGKAEAKRACEQLIIEGQMTL